MLLPRLSPGLRRGIGYALLALAILMTLGFIFGHSLQNAAASNSASHEVLDKVDPIVDPLLQGVTGSKPDTETKHLFLRKAAHFLEFALLGIEFTLLALYHQRKIASSLLFMPPFAVLASAVIDETLQSLGDRTDSVRDVCLDFAGGMSGMAAVILIALILILVRKGRKTKTPSLPPI